MAVNRAYDLGRASDPGRRRGKENEDRLDAYEPQDHGQWTRKGALFVVADGMGGPQAGGVASDRAVRKVIEDYYYGAPTQAPKESLAQAVKAANAALVQLGKENPDWKDMGSTVVVAAVRGDELFVGNKGDSRALLFRPGQPPRQLSVDHTAAAEKVRKGAMTEEEARHSPESHQLMHRLGKVTDLESDLVGPEKLLTGDVLVLCTDGLYTQLSAEEIQDVVLRFPAQEAADKLVARARSGPGTDNSSVIVVKWLGAAAAAAMRAAPAGAHKGGGIPWVPVALALVAIAAVVTGIALRSRSAPRAPTPTAVMPSPAAGTPTQVEILLATATPRAGLAGPTSTLVPTATRIPATNTPVPTNTPRAPSYPAPQLQEPPEGAGVSGDTIHLRWTWPRRLGADEHFDLWAWSRGEPEKANQWLDSSDVNIYPPGSVGVKLWKVRVVKGEPGKAGAQIMSPWSETRSFDYKGAAQNAPTNTPRPRNTPVPRDTSAP